MKSSAWRIFLVVFLLTAVAVGYMEYVKRRLVSENRRLDQQVNDVTTRVTALRARERKLAVDREARTILEAHLLDPEAGTLYRQLLMVLVQSSQQSRTSLGRLQFAAQRTTGGVKETPVMGTVTGSEEQVLQFIEALEHGQPLARVQKLNWTLALGPGVAPKPGTVDFELVLLGPLDLTSKDSAAKS